MNISLIFIIAILASRTAYAANVFKNERKPLDESLKFLRYNINEGFRIKNNEENGHSTPTRSIEHIRFVSKKKYEILKKNKLEQTKSVICFPTGTCVDVEDLGVHPR